MKLHKIIAITAIFASASAFAGTGGMPKGKPFIELAGQIIEVEGAVAELDLKVAELEKSVTDQVNVLINEVSDLALAVGDLEGRVDTIEERVGANEIAINKLETESAALTIIVNNVAAGLTTLQDEVDALTLANEELQLAVDNGDFALQSQIDINNELITSLGVAIAENKFGLEAQIENNALLISTMKNEIVSINAQLALKQNIINGVCAEGTAFQSVDSNGGVVCTVTSGGSANIEEVRVTNYATSPVLRQSRVCYYYGCYNRNVYDVAIAAATCPVGYTLTGGGNASVGYGDYNMPSSSHPASENTFTRKLDDRVAPEDIWRTWVVQEGYSNTLSNSYAYATALCIKFK